MSQEPPNEPWLARVFPTVCRYVGLILALYLIFTEKVAPEVGLAFAGSLITGTLWLEDKLRGGGPK